MPERLNVIALGFTMGIVVGIYILFLGMLAWLFDWGTQVVEIISNWYIGFSPTLTGSLIGAVWGFFDGFIVGVIIAWLYNKFKKIFG